MRGIEFESFQAHSEPLFKKLGLFNFDDLFKLDTAMFTFNVHDESTSSFFINEFTSMKKLYIYNTRESSQNSFSLPSVSTEP